MLFNTIRILTIETSDPYMLHPDPLVHDTVIMMANQGHALNMVQAVKFVQDGGVDNLTSKQKNEVLKTFAERIFDIPERLRFWEPIP